MPNNAQNQAKKRPPLNFEHIQSQANGYYVSRIFPAVGIKLHSNHNKHQPCPMCGGSDRFRCDDKNGTGSWICNQCGAGTGYTLVRDYTGNDAYETHALIADILGIDGGKSISDADRKAWAKAQAERESAEKQAKKQARQTAAKTAQDRWHAATPCDTHPYLAKKGVSSHGLRVDDKGNLLIPLYFHNTSTGNITLCNVQSISADGTKLFVKDGLVGGAFYTLGIPLADETIFICEGYATGASIFESIAGKHPVIITFNADNLVKCSSIVRTLYTQSRLIFCADDDKATEIKTGKNTGLLAGEQAAHTAGGEVISPDFGGDKRAETGELTDYNDLHAHFGIDVVKAQITHALNRPRPTEKSQTTAEPAMSEQLKIALQRYAKIIDNGKMTNRVYDADGKMQYAKTQFEHKVGKATAKEWFAHETMTIEQHEVDAERRIKQDASIQSMLDRYGLIFGTKEVWDNRLNTRFLADAIRMAHPNEFDNWLKSPSRATIMPHHIFFDPSDTKRPTDLDNPQKGVNYVNSFAGLPMLPLSDAELDNETIQQLAKPMTDTLLHLCEYDTHAYEWVMRWLAIPLQRLGTKMDTALILHGHMQGAGKSLFFDQVMSEIYGQYAVILGQGQLEQEYNEWIVDKMYAVFEEVFSGKDRYTNMGKVKQLITSKTIYISKKYANGWTQDNLVNMVFLSNDIMPLQLEQADRRFMVINPNTKIPEHLRLGISQALKDPDRKVIRAFLSVLLDFDLGEQNEHTHPPMTNAKRKLINVSMPSWERFFEEWQSGFLPVQYQTITTHELYLVYKMYCVRNGEAATGKNKFSAYINAQDGIISSRLWYVLPQARQVRRQATWVVVGELGASQGSRELWLGYRYNDFKNDLERSEWYS